MRGVLDLGQQTVEQSRARHLALGHGHFKAVQELAQALQLFQSGGVMHPVHAGLTQPFQFQSRAHIGLNHEIFDQAVAVQLLARADAHHLAVIGQHHFAFGQVQFQRAPFLPGGKQCFPRPVQRSDDRRHQRLQIKVGQAVLGRLHPFIGQTHGRPHQTAQKAVFQHLAVLVDAKPYGNAGAVFVGFQRTPAVG